MSDQKQVQAMMAAVNESWPEMSVEQRQRVIEAKGSKLNAVLSQIDGILSHTHQVVEVPIPTLQIDRSQPFDSVEFIGGGWERDASETEDQVSLAVETLDLTQFRFEHMLENDENKIKGEEKLMRLRAREDLIRADAKIGQTLYEDWQKHGKNSVLEHLYHTQGVTWMDLPGTVLLSPDVNRYVLFLFRFDNGWYRDCRWLDNSWRVSGPSLVFCKPASR